MSDMRDTPVEIMDYGRTAGSTPGPSMAASVDEHRRTSAQVADMLRLVNGALAPQRRLVHAGDLVCAAGDRFRALYLINSGYCKLVHQAADGREQLVGLRFRGDWLGLDGIDSGRLQCDVVATDTGEIWTLPYDALIAASARHPQLLTLLHAAMSREIARDRDSMISVCTLPADARVAEFLCRRAHALAERGLRNDQIDLQMSRAEIGNHLGLTLESVSRALSRLARSKLISFVEKGRRDIRIPDIDGLLAFVQVGAPRSPMLAS